MSLRSSRHRFIGHEVGQVIKPRVEIDERTIQSVWRGPQALPQRGIQTVQRRREQALVQLRQVEHGAVAQVGQRAPFLASVPSAPSNRLREPLDERPLSWFEQRCEFVDNCANILRRLVQFHV